MVSDLNDCQKNFYVVHNIDGLREGFLEHGINFVKYCEEQKIEVEDFFSKEYQVKFTEEVKKKYDLNCLIIIDEAHEWFSRVKSTLKMWLSYHRHLNQTVWLVAHRSTNIPSIYRSFVEVEYRAKHSSIIALPMLFFYNRIVGGERIGYTYCRKKQEIFNLYKSQNEGFKKTRPSLLLPIMILTVIAGVAYFFIIPTKVIGKGKTNQKKEDKLEVKSISDKQADDREYRLAGCIGDNYLIQDRSGNILKIKDMKNKLMLMPQDSGKDSIVVYDLEKKRKIIINKMPWQERPAMSEPVGSQPVGVKK
jgi:hypothetical protein